MWPFSLFRRKEEETEVQDQFYGTDDYYERDMEMVISKLDLVNARLENINTRLQRLEEFMKRIP